MSARLLSGVGVALGGLVLAVVFGVSLTAKQIIEVEYRVAFQCADDSWVAAHYIQGQIECRNDSTGSVSAGWTRELWLVDLNGGDLEDGDQVAIEYHHPYQGFILSTEQYDGEPLWTEPGYWDTATGDEKFVIETLDCDNCSVSEGGRIALKSVALDYYWRAANGGSDVVDVNATSVGGWEAFELVICGSTC